MKRKLLVVDTETGGLDPQKHAIMSIAALVYHDGVVEDQYTAFVGDYHGEIEEQALAVNGITEDQMLGAQSVLLVTFAIEAMLQRHDMRGKVTLVGHGVNFDIGFMRRLWALAGQDFDARFERRPICTQTLGLLLEQAGRIRLPGGSGSLDALSEALGCGRRDARHHNSLEDALLTAQCLRRGVQMMTLTGSTVR